MLELMIVVALIFIFSTLTLPMGFSFYQESSLKDQAKNLENALRKARTMAMTGKGESSAGVALEEVSGRIGQTWQYVIFEGDSDKRRDQMVIPFPIALSVSGTTKEIVFEKLSGLPVLQQEETITLEFGSFSIDVTVNAQGKIERYPIEKR